MKTAVVYIVNSNYFNSLICSLKSLYVNGQLSCDIVIMHTDELCYNKIPVHKDYKIIYKFIPEYKEYNKYFSRNWGISPVCKFDIFKLREYDKILYLDSDTIILNSISDIFNFEGDFNISCAEYKHNLVYNNEQIGFNAGVMVIGKSHLNETIREELLNIIQAKQFSGNQIPLNLLFADKITPMPISYNTTLDLLSRIDFKDIKILHFIEYKPWGTTNKGYIENYIGRVAKLQLRAIYLKYLYA